MVAYTDYRTDTRVRREAEALAARGDCVTVISLAPSGQTRFNRMNGVRLKPVKVTRYRGSSAWMYLASYLVFFIRASFRLAVLHIRLPFHVVQVHTLPDFMVFTAIVPKFLGARVILDVHDLMPELYRSKFSLEERHPLIRLITWVERASVAFADRAIAVNKVQMEALVRHGNPVSKFTVLMNLPDPALFSRVREAPIHPHGNGLKMIYHGTVSHRHGLQVLVKTMAILQAELEGLELHIIGDGDALPPLVRLVEGLGLSGRVRISCGFFPPEEIVPLIRAADVGVAPTLVDAFTCYMLPVKLLEYVALGLPVICTRTWTLEAYFEDRMVSYFRSGDLQDLAGKIRELYWNPKKRMDICTHAERFNWEYNWEQHKILYFNLVDDLCRAGKLQAIRQPAARRGRRLHG
jgi:glycosyltransferase involved in cell wall biosynthesis